MSDALHIAIFGSSITSSYWNGAATYYRGLVRALHALGHHVSFYEPDALDRQAHRDLDDVDWVESIVYPAESEADARQAIERVREADVVIKCSGVGAHDEALEAGVLDHQERGAVVAFLDVDAPATLERVASLDDDPLAELIPRYDLVLTYGGGPPVVRAYVRLGAKHCLPIYNALDPSTHHPAPADERYRCDLAFLGNRLPDREARVEEFFLKPAAQLPDRAFLIGGSGWSDRPMPGNVRDLGHVYVPDHNAFNCTPLAVLNISRESMARFGFSPATRVFEATGAGACVITDAWEGVDQFFEPGREILVASDGDEVAEILANLTPERARAVGELARRRALRDHTYERRARQLVTELRMRLGSPAAEGAAP